MSLKYTKNEITMCNEIMLYNGRLYSVWLIVSCSILIHLLYFNMIGILWCADYAELFYQFKPLLFQGFSPQLACVVQLYQ